MNYFNFSFYLNKNDYVVSTLGPGMRPPGDSDDEVTITFSDGWRKGRRGRILLDHDFLRNRGIDWLWTKGDDWFMDFDKLGVKHPGIPDKHPWLNGVERVSPETTPGHMTGIDGSIPTRGVLKFQIFKEEMTVDRNRKIFLSHKSKDKPLVREYAKTLTLIGFDPWIDEDAMVAGTPLERGLREGFEHSCAAVFFITANFKDENYLASEIDYAREELRKKGNRFQIITLKLGGDKNAAVVPPLLKTFVYKEPKTHLAALREILRALPLEVGHPQWRGHISQSGGG